MGEIMQWTASFTTDTAAQTLLRTPNNVLAYPYGTRRGMPVASVADGAALVERVLLAADIERAMRVELTRVLMVTVRDWGRK